jgi:hypothetical protein
MYSHHNMGTWSKFSWFNDPVCSHLGFLGQDHKKEVPVLATVGQPTVLQLWTFSVREGHLPHRMEPSSASFPRPTGPERNLLPGSVVSNWLTCDKAGISSFLWLHPLPKPGVASWAKRPSVRMAYKIASCKCLHSTAKSFDFTQECLCKGNWSQLDRETLNRLIRQWFGEAAQSQ